MTLRTTRPVHRLPWRSHRAVRLLGRKTYAAASHIAVGATAIWASYIAFAAHEGDLDVAWLVALGSLAAFALLLAMARLHHERQRELCLRRSALRAERDAWQAAEWARRRAEFEEARRAAAERERADADTTVLPAFLRGQRSSTVYTSLRDTAEDLLRMQLQFDLLESPTEDIRVA